MDKQQFQDEQLENQIPPKEVLANQDVDSQFIEEENQPKNPFDISQDMGLLEELQNELQQTLSSIDSQFASFYAQNMPANVEELFYEDRAKFLLEVEKAKQAYLEERMQPLQQRATNLQDTISNKQNQSTIWEAQIAFTKKNPNVDLDELLAFYNEELSPRQKKELEKLGDINAMYEQILVIMQGRDAPGNNQEANIESTPKRGRPKQNEQQNTRNFPIDTSDAQFANRSQMDEDIARDSDLPINRR